MTPVKSNPARPKASLPRDSKLSRYETANPPVVEIFLTATQARRRYGWISEVTLWRWLHDSQLDFCSPIVIGHHRYWKLAELEAFERCCATRNNCRIARAGTRG